MTPGLHGLTDDALRRHLAERLGYRIYANRLGRHGHYVCMTPPTVEWDYDDWRQFWDGVRAYPTEAEAWTSPDVPDWPNDANASLEALMELSGARGLQITLERDPASDEFTADAEFYLGCGIFNEIRLAGTFQRALAELLAAALEADR